MRPATKRALIIVPAAQQKEANAACLTISPYARDTFSVSHKQGSHTFFVCSWRMTDEQLAMFRTMMDSHIRGKRIVVFENRGRAKLKELNLRPNKGE